MLNSLLCCSWDWNLGDFFNVNSYDAKVVSSLVADHRGVAWSLKMVNFVDIEVFWKVTWRFIVPRFCMGFPPELFNILPHGLMSAEIPNLCRSFVARMQGVCCCVYICLKNHWFLHCHCASGSPGLGILDSALSHALVKKFLHACLLEVPCFLAVCALAMCGWACRVTVMFFSTCEATTDFKFELWFASRWAVVLKVILWTTFL